MSDLIEQAMKDKSNFYLRLTSAGKWLVWQAPDSWVVYGRGLYAKKTKTLYEGRSLERALEILLEDNKMSATKINDDCVLIEITNTENEFYKNGYRYVLEGKRLGSKTIILDDAEFNALALRAPMVGRMVDIIDAMRGDEVMYAKTHGYKPDELPNLVRAKQLLADIAELEKPK